jgi:mRNA-degrading endonuclease toxin of MazEF toxin-antitoxin module
MAYAQGSIVLVENPYADGLRPVMIVSNDERPYQGKQYTIAIVTTTERDDAVQLAGDDLTEGSLNVDPSFVNPWSVHEFEHAEIVRRIAQASDGVIRGVADGVARFTELEGRE